MRGVSSTQNVQLAWEAARSLNGFEACVGNVIYRVDEGCGGYGGNAAFLIVRGPRGASGGSI
jgi:hypothetical protein